MERARVIDVESKELVMVPFIGKKTLKTKRLRLWDLRKELGTLEEARFPESSSTMREVCTLGGSSDLRDLCMPEGSSDLKELYTFKGSSDFPIIFVPSVSLLEEGSIGIRSGTPSSMQ
ncbi:hypothetical protein LguiA_018894 [Lonicera macranthoides]